MTAQIIALPVRPRPTPRCVIEVYPAGAAFTLAYTGDSGGYEETFPTHADAIGEARAIAARVGWKARLEFQ